MSTKKKYNIYYLEDTPDHYNRVYKELTRNRKLNLLPSPENWEAELDLFAAYFDGGQTAADGLKIINLLKGYDICLIILDQKINSTDSAGAKLVDHLLSQNSAFKDLKIIIFSGTPGKQRAPVDYISDNLQMKGKGDMKESVEILLKDIVNVLKIKGETFAQTLERISGSWEDFFKNL